MRRGCVCLLRFAKGDRAQDHLAGCRLLNFARSDNHETIRPTASAKAPLMW
jgi:hypothetical protein